MPIPSNTRPARAPRRRSDPWWMMPRPPNGCYRLQALITRQQRAIQDAMVGRDREGVCLKSRDALRGRCLGKSDYLHAVHVTDCAISKSGRLRR